MHTRLSKEIDKNHAPSPYTHTVEAARAQSELVGLRASLMVAHLDSMLERMDKPDSESAQS